MPPTRSICKLVGLLIVLLALVAPAGAGEAQPRARVGELAPSDLSTAHPYPGGTVRIFEVHHPGATYIKVHFSRFDTFGNFQNFPSVQPLLCLKEQRVCPELCCKGAGSRAVASIEKRSGF